MLSALWVFTCSIAQANYTTIGLVSSNRAPSSFHRNPMVTGTSVLGVKFTGGVVIAADMLGSYGSLARFRNISRLMKVMPPPAEVSRPTACFSNFNIGVSSTGEQQHHPGSLGRLRRLPTPETGHRADGVSARAHTHTRMWVCTLTYTHLYIPLPISLVSFSVSIDEELLGDGHSYSPKAVHSWLTRVMYNRRSRMNPLWNTVVIGGFYNGERWDSGWLGSDQSSCIRICYRLFFSSRSVLFL